MCEKHLDVVLDLMAVIPRDPKIIKAIQKQRPLLQMYPGSPAAIEFRKMAALTDTWPRTTRANGKLEFFLERIIGSNVADKVGVLS